MKTIGGNGPAVKGERPPVWRPPSHPPRRYVDLDDFLWREFVDRDDWASWVSQRSASEGVARDARYAAAKQLQAALRELQYVNDGGEGDQRAADRLNAMIERFDVRPVVHADGSNGFVAASGAVARLLVAALTAMSDGSWRRFKRCRNRACSGSFYDSSKNATRSWCSMARCGAREKMRRLRAPPP